MAQILELKSQIKFQCPAAKFYNVWRKEACRLLKISPGDVRGVILISGDWTTLNSVKTWTFIISEGTEKKTETVEVKVESIDDGGKSITFDVQKGNIMEDYESIKFILQVTETTVTTATVTTEVTWTAKYKNKEGKSAKPKKYLDLLEKISKNVDVDLRLNV